MFGALESTSDHNFERGRGNKPVKDGSFNSHSGINPLYVNDVYKRQ